MIEPRLAAVRPRVLSSETADSVLLEDEVLARLERRQWGPIKLFAGAGCGKSTALAHLAAVLGPDVVDSDGPVLLVDEPNKREAERIFAARHSHLIVYTGTRDIVPRDATVLGLARWGLDECIEYLLCVHKERCASVMARFQAAADRQMLAGVPELITVVLDRMAADETLGNCHAALRAEVYLRLPDAELRTAAQKACLETLAASNSAWNLPADSILSTDRALDAARLLRHEGTRLVLSADLLAKNVRQRAGEYLLARQLSRDLVHATALIIRDQPAALSYLQELVKGRHHKRHAMAGSLLWAAGVPWQPTTRYRPNLAGAYLANVSWPRVRLAKVDLTSADLSGADLSESDLERALVSCANLSDARLHGARLTRLGAVGARFAGADLSFVRASDAVFSRADLSGANLEGALLDRCILVANLSKARLVRANLRSAILNGAQIEEADFTGADLSESRLEQSDLRTVALDGACLSGTYLMSCNLEGMVLHGPQLMRAHLDGALLTGSVMHDGRFERASLRGAGLADIQWERADLRDADLRGATFHLGSSRSGLVGSPIACEGSRTGFYTDEYHEQDFKSPEEIRKANLCGADLRGARIDNVDFYLVDLRGAKYTEDQMKHLQRCRAILHARV